jgi:N-acetylglucosaminyldiphosphoundecaprenol N-acetyl-beta-D-mannosaminyltransferase
VVNHLPAHPTVLALRAPSFRDVLNRADLNVADGKGVVWASRLQGFTRMRQRVYGPDFLLRIAAWSEPRELRHAFVGGTPITLSRLTSALQRRFPQLRIVAKHAPPMRPVTPAGVEEDARLLGEAADFLWVGLGTPKQQVWADLARVHRPAKVILTVGAAFDFLAGTKPQAPRWMQDAGLEWAFRFAMEPRRLWRRAILDNGIFIWAVGRDVMSGRRGQP